MNLDNKEKYLTRLVDLCNAGYDFFKLNDDFVYDDYFCYLFGLEYKVNINNVCKHDQYEKIIHRPNVYIYNGEFYEYNFDIVKKWQFRILKYFCDFLYECDSGDIGDIFNEDFYKIDDFELFIDLEFPFNFSSFVRSKLKYSKLTDTKSFSLDFFYRQFLEKVNVTLLKKLEGFFFPAYIGIYLMENDIFNINKKDMDTMVFRIKEIYDKNNRIRIEEINEIINDYIKTLSKE